MNNNPLSIFPHPTGSSPSGSQPAGGGPWSGGNGNRGYPPAKVLRVHTLGILMIVQGALECAIGLMLVLVGFVFLFSREARSAGPAMAFLVIFGVVVAGAGGLLIRAGREALKYRRRSFVSTVLIVSAVPMLLVLYCLPTAIALLVYGLVLLSSNDARRAFEMGESGFSPDEIRAGGPAWGAVPPGLNPPPAGWSPLPPGGSAPVPRPSPVMGTGAIVGIVIAGVVGLVMLVGIIAAIAIPSLLRARAVANESVAIGNLRTLGSAQATYQSRRNRFGTIAGLVSEQLLDRDWRDGVARDNYVISCDLERAGMGFSANADPVDPYGGIRHFFIDETYVVRAAEKGAADESDPPIGQP